MSLIFFTYFFTYPPLTYYTPWGVPPLKSLLNLRVLSINVPRSGVPCGTLYRLPCVLLCACRPVSAALELVKPPQDFWGSHRGLPLILHSC